MALIEAIAGVLAVFIGVVGFVYGISWVIENGGKKKPGKKITLTEAGYSADGQFLLVEATRRNDKTRYAVKCALCSAYVVKTKNRSAIHGDVVKAAMYGHKCDKQLFPSDPKELFE